MLSMPAPASTSSGLRISNGARARAAAPTRPPLRFASLRALLRGACSRGTRRKAACATHYWRVIGRQSRPARTARYFVRASTGSHLSDGVVEDRVEDVVELCFAETLLDGQEQPAGSCILGEGQAGELALTDGHAETARLDPALVE